jgi:hypothetical protein
MTENESILWLIVHTTDPWSLMLLSAVVFSHPILRVVNVHWADGLAVIFAPRDEDSPEQDI